MRYAKHVRLRTLSTLNLLLVASLLLPLGCTTSRTDDWSPDVYAGDHKAQAVVRGQADHSIECSDKRFSELFCIFDRDMEKLLKKCLEDKPFWIF